MYFVAHAYAFSTHKKKIDHNVLTEIMSDFLKTVSRIFNSRGGGAKPTKKH